MCSNFHHDRKNIKGFLIGANGPLKWEHDKTKCFFRGIVCTKFDLQNETWNNEIHYEVFEELDRKGGAECKYEVLRNAPGDIRLEGHCYLYKSL